MVQDQNASNFEKTPHLNTISHCTAVYSQKINTTTHELKYYYLHATRNTNKSSSDQKDQTKKWNRVKNDQVPKKRQLNITNLANIY